MTVKNETSDYSDDSSESECSDKALSKVSETSSKKSYKPSKKSNNIDKSWIDELSESDYEDIEETILERIHYTMESNIVTMASPNFSKNIITSVSETLFDEWCDANICQNTDDDYEDLVSLIDTMFLKYIDEYAIIPPRQSTISQKIDTFQSISYKDEISKKIEYLQNIPQPTQRTREWYESRHNMITASNISKALGSDAQKNSLIYEKCKPLVYDANNNMVTGNYINTENSMHWGVKYEPVTAMIYQAMFCTEIADFGCIVHRKYPFIGASPDGIVVNRQHDRYGHMLEIKNIVNREITGIPKEEYWVQMQVQMETCDLDYCDFVETRIKEFENEYDFYQDSIHEYKGVILYFVKKILVTNQTESVRAMNHHIDNTPHYVYMPLDAPCSEVDVQLWIQEMRNEHREQYVLHRTHYWYLDEISCILVQRNRAWFEAAVPVFTEVWKTIEKERISGYEHRVAKKRQIQISHASDGSNIQFIQNMPTNGNTLCLIKLDQHGNIAT